MNPGCTHFNSEVVDLLLTSGRRLTLKENRFECIVHRWGLGHIRHFRIVTIPSCLNRIVSVIR